MAFRLLVSWPSTSIIAPAGGASDGENRILVAVEVVENVNPAPRLLPGAVRSGLQSPPGYRQAAASPRHPDPTRLTLMSCGRRAVFGVGAPLCCRA